MDTIPKTPSSGSKSRIEQKRVTLGFLLASLHTGVSLTIWPSLLDAARRHDVNLICFPGGRLNAAESFEIQRNVIFELVSEEYLDGLITWSSSLVGVLGPGEIQAFHERYRPLPMVSLAQFMEGMPTVSLDSYLGMRALLAHLIEVHHYHKLAFIRGPEEHYYAQERYRAYLDSLQAYDLPFIPELVTLPLPWESGSEAVQSLMDERGLRPGMDFQAVVASSDMMALWALKALQARGFRVPDEVAVTGFNNSTEERLATPPLTTVDLPFYEQGAKAMDVLLRLLSGESVPALITLPSKLIVRQSCGCPSAAIAQAAYTPPNEEALPKDETMLKGVRAECLYEMVSAIGAAPEEAVEWAGHVYDAFVYDVENISAAKTPRRLLTVLDSVLDQSMRANHDVVPWQDAISLLRRRAMPYVPRSRRAEVEALFSQARVVIIEAIQRAHAYWQWQANRDAENLREMNRDLLVTFDIQQLIEVLVERLPSLGIPSAYLVLYEPGIETDMPKQARLILAYKDGEQAALEPGGMLFSTHQLVPLELLPQQRRYSLVAEPLFFQERPLGYVVFEIGPYNGHVYELLRNTLSSALQGALLFQESQRARLAAEKADRIKTRLLANVTHEMRTPLNIILGYTQDALRTPNKYGDELPSSLSGDIRQIQSNAEHQLRVINDLLDLSRAEIDELDLSLQLLDPHQLLVDAFHSFADHSTWPTIQWKINIPDHLPQIRADAVRLRQILLNLLSNAKKYTEKGEITLGAEVTPPQIHFWVTDTGLGIDPEQQERIFEPFVTVEDNRRIAGGIGLGLSITRRLVALHNGTMRLESQPGVGSTFHIYLPLPALEKTAPAKQEDLASVLLLISSHGEPKKEIIEMCRRQGLEIFKLCNIDDLETALRYTKPVVLAWDLSNAQPGDWTIVRRLRHYPDLCQSPFLLYGKLAEEELGITGFVVKSANTSTLLDAITAMSPAQGSGPILIVDDDPPARVSHRALVEESLPGYPIRLAENGEEALAVMQEAVPSLVLLDLVMPRLSGADVLDQMRSDPKLRQVPVIILSNKMLTMDDIKRIEGHTRVKLQSKGIWSDAETITAVDQAIFGTDTLSVHTSGAVKQAIAYIHQNYTRPVSRWEIAKAVGVSEDYLSRVFDRELNISPWEYLNRFRVLQSKHLLLERTDTIGVIAHQVGFKDQAYFSRVFRKITGISPQGFRESNIKRTRRS